MDARQNCFLTKFPIWYLSINFLMYLELLQGKYQFLFASLISVFCIFSFPYFFLKNIFCPSPSVLWVLGLHACISIPRPGTISKLSHILYYSWKFGVLITMLKVEKIIQYMHTDYIFKQDTESIKTFAGWPFETCSYLITGDSSVSSFQVLCGRSLLSIENSTCWWMYFEKCWKFVEQYFQFKTSTSTHCFPPSLSALYFEQKPSHLLSGKLSWLYIMTKILSISQVVLMVVVGPAISLCLK